jgi:hypothetical protein
VGFVGLGVFLAPLLLGFLLLLLELCLPLALLLDERVVGFLGGLVIAGGGLREGGDGQQKGENDAAGAKDFHGRLAE